MFWNSDIHLNHLDMFVGRFNSRVETLYELDDIVSEELEYNELEGD